MPPQRPAPSLKPPAVGPQKIIETALRKGFSIRRPLLYDESSDQFVYAHSKKPIGYYLVRRIERKPQLAKQLVSKAWERYRGAITEIPELERLANDRTVPIETVMDKRMVILHDSQTGALDFVFDPKEYVSAVKRHLKPGFPESVIQSALETITPAYGTDSGVTRDRAALVRLANEYGRHHQNGYAFHQYDWEWYRHNFAIVAPRKFQLQITDSMLRDSVEDVRKSRGIPEGDFDAVLRALKDLRFEAFSKAGATSEAQKHVLRYAKSGSKRTLKALFHFAGNAMQLNETMHTTNARCIELGKLAAEKRGLPVA